MKVFLNFFLGIVSYFKKKNVNTCDCSDCLCHQPEGCGCKENK
ncbi:hypothetical protein [Clostridium aceticum]|nr:hypothetical protein [Clostridium aceticum]